MYNQLFIENIFIIASSFIICSTFAQHRIQNSDDIFFDGDVNEGNRDDNGDPILPWSTNNHMTPAQSEIIAAQRFNEILTIEDFLREVEGIPEGENIGNPDVDSRFGDERANVEVPKRATCAPELQTVCLRNSSSILYFPECTRIHRCGGCCQNSKLVCEPTATATRNFRVYASELIDLKFKYKGKEVIPVEEHINCSCGCKVKAEHCNARQIYSPNECRCVCIDTDEESKCRGNGRTKKWDSDSCSCTCIGRSECTTGAYYDHNSCSCKMIMENRRRYQNSPRNSFPGSDSSAQYPIIRTINAADPRRRQKDDPE